MRPGGEHLRQALRVKQGIDPDVELRRRPDRNPRPSTLRNRTEAPLQKTKQRLGLAFGSTPSATNGRLAMSADPRGPGYIRRLRTTGLLFFVPALVLLAAFLPAPIFVAVFVSFTKFTILSPPTFVGLANYARIFTMPFTAPQAGDVEVLRQLRDDLEIGLGCVSVPSGQVDSPEAIVGRVEQALRHVPAELHRQMLHPQPVRSSGNSCTDPSACSNSSRCRWASDRFRG